MANVTKKRRGSPPQFPVFISTPETREKARLAAMDLMAKDLAGVDPRRLIIEPDGSVTIANTPVK